MRKALGLLAVSCLFAAPIVHAESPVMGAISVFLEVAQRDARTAMTLQETRALTRLSAESESRLTNSGLNAKGYYIVTSSDKRDVSVVMRAVGNGADETANWAPYLPAQQSFNNVGTIEIGISRGLTVEEQGKIDVLDAVSAKSIQNAGNRVQAEAVDLYTNNAEGMRLLKRVQRGAVEGGLPEGDNVALGMPVLTKDSFGRWILVRTVKIKAADLDVAVLQNILREVAISARAFDL